MKEKNFVKEVTEHLAADPQTTANRFAALIKEHEKQWGKNYMLFSSPGRIEVCGNHTDHNNGKVVAAAVTADTLAVVTPLNGSKVMVKSVGYPEVEVDISDTSIHESEKGTSLALVRGVVKGMRDRGYQTGGFAATTVSQVCKGAGMSSSASFEVLVCEILNELYNNGVVPPIQKAIISQYAENVYFGKPSGLMDQASIALGGISYIDFKDTAAPEVRKPLWDFKDIPVVVVNCGGDHCDLTPQYAAIRYEMEEVAAYFGQKKLRFVAPESFYADIAGLRNKVSGRAVLRAMHYFEENARVDALVEAINTIDEAKAMALISASGDSSYKKLQNCYAEGDTSQPIPLALALCKRFDGVVACRVHGGGFAGTILTFVRNNHKEAFCETMSKVFGKDNVFAVGIRSTGTRKINL
ncbi:MAG: galactokinase family protein [Clostridia bacterium]|nr:galactokinase family protein [Clostridia bacterium]